MNTFGLLTLSYSSEAPYLYTTRIIQENVPVISVSKIMHFLFLFCNFAYSANESKNTKMLSAS